METLTTTRYRSYQGGYFQTLITPEQTGNAMALLEFTLPKGAEPPPHIHANEDEAFYVLDGEISFTIGDKVTTLKRGEAIFAPRNVPHAFEILTATATLMNMVTPGTFWNFFIEFSEPLSKLPATIAAPPPPPMDAIKVMQDVIMNVYNVNFYNPSNN